MSYTVRYEHPHFDTEPAGDMEEVVTFSIAGLGEVKNGGTIEVDADMERNFVASNAMTMEDAFANSATVTLSGSSELSADELEQLIPVQEVDEEEPATPSHGVTPDFLASNDEEEGDN